MAEFRCKVTVDHLISHDAGVNWIDLYHSPYINVSRKNIEHLGQNPFGRFTLEETVKK
ncbi:ABC transporter substrate-binding protein [Pseudomonas syringae]|nr:ABC transporter substrate-binding protein [Pseudomonas syringae]MBI6746756.1 ABC transporter substrate-binding protein [Pseudomonas syringae]MBI6761563.1 ABC transporter substrate-binding protein [Pseudomonas syringae]MBI6765966.1 ABC transporter substrate-binding protein [Pseudomonas syringae]MBI6785542.1 ABC transporter substrate-binding protein [Pseudomonas syringae]